MGNNGTGQDSADAEGVEEFESLEPVVTKVVVLTVCIFAFLEVLGVVLGSG